jgi:hypothetical protein
MGPARDLLKGVSGELLTGTIEADDPAALVKRDGKDDLIHGRIQSGHQLGVVVATLDSPPPRLRSFVPRNDSQSLETPLSSLSIGSLTTNLKSRPSCRQTL